MAPDDDREHHEGPEAAQRFQRTLSRVLTVSKDELTKREAAYKKATAKRPRRGPVPKR